MKSGLDFLFVMCGAVLLPAVAFWVVVDAFMRIGDL